MTAAGRQLVHSASVRVALTAAAVVAIIYLAIAGAVVTISTQNLTAQVDARLTDTLNHISREPGPGGGPSGGGGQGGPGGFRPPDRGPYDAPYIVWTIQPDGTVTSSSTSAILPVAYYDVTTPTTVVLNDTPVRIRGIVTDDGDRVVVGQSMEAVNQAQATIILALVVIGPILLIAVFLGAVAIGRRVATPIELARQRQMEFTADASHELRTPLSVIEAHTSLALAQERSSDWYRNAFGRIDRESRRMRRLLDDLLWLARFDVTEGQPHAEPVDLAVLAAQTVDRFGIVAQQRRLALTVEATPGSNVINAPPEWLDRLLGVLLDNACKYSREDGAVRVSVAADGPRIRLTVDDSGPGIPEAERERIFDRFHRATSETTNAAGGAGLGLAIADSIVRATNGRWRIGTSPSGGASMSVTWARALLNRGEPADSGPRPEPRSAASTEPR